MMATGDQNDILGRLKAVLPPWFPSVTPVLDGLLAAPAYALSLVYSFIAYARLQTRLETMTDGWLDLYAYDYFGLRFQRNIAESDVAFRARITPEIFRPRVTRAAIIKALTDLTGRVPGVFEPARPADTGGWGVAMGYGVAGAWGSLLYPYQAFITAYRPIGTGIPSVAGWGAGPGGYGSGAIEWGNLSQVKGQVTDATIYATISAVEPVATIMWTRIQS